MNKAEKIIVLTGIVILGLLAIIAFAPTNQPFGSLNVNENAYSGAVTYSTSSIGTDTATSLLAKATSSRTFAKVCNQGASIVFIYKQSTSTGIVTGMGTPLFATSSYLGSCVTYDEIDPYLGQIWGIALATSTVSVESKQE